MCDSAHIEPGTILSVEVTSSIDPALSGVDSPEAIARDVAAIGRISAVPLLLRIICDNTGMRFAAVARVTAGTWTVCAVEDRLEFGLTPGGQLPVESTLCRESREMRRPIMIDDAGKDEVYRNHPTLRLYHIESYVSVPIVRKHGEYFGNLCAIDPRPALVSDDRTRAMFTAFAELIAAQLEGEDRQIASDSALSDEKAVSDLREQFIAVLGHDLRNPLAAISMMAESLVRGKAPGDLVDFGKRLRAASSRMAGLIDDVLDFTRGRLGGGIGVEIAQASDLAAALRAVVEEIRVSHPDRELLDRIDIDVPVHCDRGRVQQLLSNLLGNAIAYGEPQSRITIEAGIDAETLLLAVHNFGNPISPTDLQKIFAPYWRPATSKPGGGLGLGLHICAQIVKAHQGTLEVTSSAEQGTRFVARLPIAAGV